MKKVLKITEEKAVIGMDDNTTKTYDLSGFNYNPLIGDEVEIYGSEENPIISKVEPKQTNDQGNNGAGSQNVYVNVNTANETNNKKVNKVVYCLLALFLGGIGAHEFYAGYIGRGVVMLLFCLTGIPAIVALIQFIIVLCKKSDANGLIEV